MDSIRQYAETVVRRAAGCGLAAIGAVAAACASVSPPLALHWVAVLLSIEAVLLLFWARHASWLAPRPRQAWLPVGGRSALREKRLRGLIAQAVSESCVASAKHLAGPTAAAWVLVVGGHLFG